MLQVIESRLIKGLLAGAAASLLGACASKPPMPPAPPPVVEEKAAPQPSPESQHIAELEKQLHERQRVCLDDRRRLEGALRESQKKLDETQRKLKALLAVERALRRGKEQ